MKYLMGLVALVLATFSVPVLAQSSPPVGTDMVLVTLGKLEPQSQVVMTNPKTGEQLRVKMGGCNENWATNEPFVFIRSKDNHFYLIRARRFFFYYDTNKNWDMTISNVNRDGAICSVLL